MRTLADEIIYGSAQGVRQLLDAGEAINVIDEYGFTPLIESVIFNKLDVAKMLLDRGAYVNAPDASGQNGLHWAVDYKYRDMVKLLLDYKADPNAYNKACQPVLTFPLLRGQEDLKELLYQAGADLDFAQDFINTKLVGHRYELEGQTHVMDTNRKFILVDFEGFFLEFTLSIVCDSLQRYKNNFAAKHLRSYFNHIKQMLASYEVASELISYQHFEPVYQQHEARINELLDNNLLLIPVAYEGHAVTCIICDDLWIKVDRGWNAKIEGSVVVYRIKNRRQLTKDFIKQLIYKKQSRQFVNEGINQILDLQKIAEIPLPLQIIGNCSWANVEGSVAAMIFATSMHEFDIYDHNTLVQNIHHAMKFFNEWREWDKDRALEETIKSFYHANPERQATKAELLAMVLVYKCKYDNDRDLIRAEKIFRVLAEPACQFIIHKFIKVYIEDETTPYGENLIHLLDLVAPKGLRLSMVHREAKE